MMKKLLTMLLLSTLMVGLWGCEKDPEQKYDLDLPATQAQIQGEWLNVWNAITTTITFNPTHYVIKVEPPFNENPVREEIGTYTMEGNVIHLTALEGESDYTQLEAYIQNGNKNTIFFKPIGVFTKSTSLHQ